MNAEKIAELRAEVTTHVLEWNLRLLKESEVDVAALKVWHAMRVEEEELEIAARKFEGSKIEREFTHEETVQGIRVMLGKGNDE